MPTGTARKSPSSKRGPTKVEQIRSFLKQKIADGVYPPHAKLDAERVLTGQFKVCRATVNKVLSILVSEGLVERVTGRGTFVAAASAPLARASRSTPTMRLALVFSEPLREVRFEGYYQWLLDGVYGAASRRGYRLMMTYAPEAEQLFGEGQREVDGFLAVAVEDENLLARWRRAGVPVVLCDCEDPKGRYDAVVFDHRAEVREISTHLTDRGYRRIGLINERLHAYRETQAARQREEGLREELRARGLELSPEFIFRIPDRSDDSLDGVRAFLSREPRPQALVLFHAPFGTLVFRALGDLGLSCPRDIAVAAFATLGEASGGGPALTGTLCQAESMGALATTRLLERLDHPDREPTTTRLPAVFRAGETT